MRGETVLRSALAIIFLLTQCGFASDTKTVHCDSGKYQYHLFAKSPTVISPAILLLRGAGDNAGDFIKPWEGLAKKEGIVLIAPQLDRDKKFEDVAMGVFRCIIGDASKQAAIDPKRIYVFGHSAGGYLAYDAATLDSQFYAAVAVHGMEINADYTWIVKRAQRKTPIAIYIGDRDEFFSLDRVRKTRDLLQNAGFSVHYVEPKNHGHDYYYLSDRINQDAWEFLKDKQLP
jgi:dienelactone hydrolase